MGSNLGHSIHLMLSSSLLGNGSIQDDAEDEVDDHYEDYGNYEDDAEDQSHPEEEDIELKNYLDEFATALKKQSANEIDEILNEKLAEMVYGSNMLEADPTYKAIQTELVEKRKPSAHEDVLRAQREVVQHAKAAYYIMNEVAIKGKDLCEEIILETHRLLTYKIDSPDGIPSSEYGGIYRNCSVQRGFNSFPHHSTVPKAVRDLTASLKADIAAAEASGEIDPVALAAKYCHKFVNIHPFLDGNSRASRLILNTILLKYGGCFVWFGKDAMEREEYMDIAAEGFATEAMAMQEDMDDLPEGFKPKYHKKLATFTLKHVYKYFGLFN
ncbi:adenosine monophosphate transferase FICD like [Fusarium mundagurra]|uniref:Adenosine monophosphate transferase FICD like n=1 Tax=Fusarium mundagurra TaxID=1567541 RepID=A0A8H6D7L2_9HYPO|nr:adenosine monophosphate transferase FICD like [Fusarium mundagurra]